MATDWHPIHTAVRTLLEADSTLVALSPSSQWHADQMPDRRTFPAIVMRIITHTPDQRLSNGDNIEWELQMDAYADREDPATLKSMADRVVAVLDRSSFTATGYRNVESMCISRPTAAKEHPYYRMRTRFKLYGSAA